MKIAISNARLSFPKLFTPEEFQGDGKPMYSCSFIIDPKNPAVKQIKDAMETLGKAKWPKEWPAVKKTMEAKDLSCLHDGDTKDFDGYAGMMYVSCRAPANKRPTIIDRDRSQLAEKDGKIYGGCYVNGMIELWVQDNKFGKRINAQVTGVQFLRDGDSFGGGAAAADAEDFADLGDGADADDMS